MNDNNNKWLYRHIEESTINGYLLAFINIPLMFSFVMANFTWPLLIVYVIAIVFLIFHMNLHQDNIFVNLLYIIAFINIFIINFAVMDLAYIKPDIFNNLSESNRNIAYIMLCIAGLLLTVKPKGILNVILKVIGYFIVYYTFENVFEYYMDVSDGLIYKPYILYLITILLVWRAIKYVVKNVLGTIKYELVYDFIITFSYCLMFYTKLSAMADGAEPGVPYVVSGLIKPDNYIVNFYFILMLAAVFIIYMSMKNKKSILDLAMMLALAFVYIIMQKTSDYVWGFVVYADANWELPWILAGLTGLLVYMLSPILLSRIIVNAYKNTENTYKTKALEWVFLYGLSAFFFYRIMSKESYILIPFLAAALFAIYNMIEKIKDNRENLLDYILLLMTTSFYALLYKLSFISEEQIVVSVIVSYMVGYAFMLIVPLATIVIFSERHPFNRGFSRLAKISVCVITILISYIRI